MAYTRPSKLARAAALRKKRMSEITIQPTAYYYLHRFFRWADWRYAARWMVRNRKVVGLVYRKGKLVGYQHIGNAGLTIVARVKEGSKAGKAA